LNLAFAFCGFAFFATSPLLCLKLRGKGPVQAKILLQHYDVAEIFTAKKSSLEKIEGHQPIN